MKTTAIALIMLCSITAVGQSIVITGNSLAQWQGGDQKWEFSLLPVQNILVHGHDSLMCRDLLVLLPYDVPASTSIVVMLESTNDVAHGLPVYQHMACINSEIALLVSRNPSIKILLANTPSWAQNNCYGDARALIAEYNAAYLSLPGTYPNVTLVDVWTPITQSNGWAWPIDMAGQCGIHPGPPDTLTLGWANFTRPITAAVYAAAGVT